MENNTIHFGNKTLILFDYFLSTNDQIKFEIQFNRIVISNGEKFTLEAFESKDLNFRFMSFLPQIWELKQYTNKDSSILKGNLCAPNIDLQGIILQNWLDTPLTIETGELLCTFEFGDSSEKILCGNKKAEDDMRSIFKDFEVNREQVIAQNFMRTVLSAISCTPANKDNNFDTL